jgi:hypothetical protein
MKKEECRMQKLWPALPRRSAGFQACHIADFPVGWVVRICLLLLLSWRSAPAGAEDLTALVNARTAIERVYYIHRLGQKPPFEQVSPPALIERLVKDDLRKEAALKQVYGVEITPAVLDTEVQRINTTTRAPEMLVEIKAALGNDPAKFASVFAKPNLVERLLREKFDNDDALHAVQRRQAEQVREKLLSQDPNPGGRASPRAQTFPENRARRDARPPERAATKNRVAQLVAILKTNAVGQFSETTWQLGARPVEANAPAADELAAKQRFGPNAQVISSPHREKERQFYFEDLPSELQRVLRVQLRQPGDVSAVIETPGGFLLYVAKEKTDTALTAACLSIPKRNYEQWLSEQK